jgi:hypothetical protein
MRLSTVLITIQSLMDTQPLRHEPGYAAEIGQRGNDYAAFVESRTIRYILDCVERKSSMAALEHFQQVFEARLPKTLERLQRRLEKLLEGGEKTYEALPYKMFGKTEYGKSLERVKCLLNKN